MVNLNLLFKPVVLIAIAFAIFWVLGGSNILSRNPVILVFVVLGVIVIMARGGKK